MIRVRGESETTMRCFSLLKIKNIYKRFWKPETVTNRRRRVRRGNLTTASFGSIFRYRFRRLTTATQTTAQNVIQASRSDFCHSCIRRILIFMTR